MKRKILSVLLVLVICIAALPDMRALAAQDVRVVLDGNPLVFDVPPQLINGRTMVPLRVIFEALGAKVYWDAETQTVTAVKGATVVELTIDSERMYSCGNMLELDSPACLVDGRTLVPARAVSEAFGMIVGWEEATQTVTIHTPTQPVEAAPATDVFTTAHRALKDFILKDGRWDEEDMCYWTGYTMGEQKEIEFDMYYEADGVTLICKITDGAQAELGLVFNEMHYPAYAMLYEDNGASYHVVGAFETANMPAKEAENTFSPEEREGAKLMENLCFWTMDTMLQRASGISLAQCGIYYEMPQIAE